MTWWHNRAYVCREGARAIMCEIYLYTLTFVLLIVYMCLFPGTILTKVSKRGGNGKKLEAVSLVLQIAPRHTLLQMYDP